MYLLDTNVWLERLLEQERSEEVKRLLERLPSHLLSISDFSFHSIGVILNRLNQRVALLEFVRDAFADGEVSYAQLEPEDTPRFVETLTRFRRRLSICGR